MSTEKTTNIKILITTSTFPRWENDSVPGFVRDYSVNLIANSYLSAVVLAPHYRGSKRLESYRGVKIYRYNYAPDLLETLAYDGGILANIKRNPAKLLFLPTFFIAQILTIKKLVKLHNINIIHAHWIIPQGLCAIIYKKLFNKNIKILVTSHGSDITTVDKSKKVLRKVIKYVLDNTDHISVVSKDLSDRLKTYGVKNSKISIIPMGYDANVFNNQGQTAKNNSKINILFAGRFVPEKNIKKIVEILYKALKITPSIHLTMVGEGPLKNNIIKLSKDLSINKNITYKNFLNHHELSKEYKKSDYFISLPTREGFGLTFVEAMACGSIPIGSPIGGVTDIIDTGKNGLLSNNTNDIVDFILKTDPSKRKMLSKNAQKKATKYTWEHSITEYGNLLKKIIR